MQADYRQHALLTAAGISPPQLPAFLLEQLLPAISARLVAQPPLSEGSAAQLEGLHLAVVGSLSRGVPLPAEQLEQLKQAPLVIDDGQAKTASLFMVLGEQAEGLRPIVSGPGFPLRPLPAKYAVRRRHCVHPKGCRPHNTVQPPYSYRCLWVMRAYGYHNSVRAHDIAAHPRGLRRDEGEPVACQQLPR